MDFLTIILISNVQSISEFCYFSAFVYEFLKFEASAVGWWNVQKSWICYDKMYLLAFYSFFSIFWL